MQPAESSACCPPSGEPLRGFFGTLVLDPFSIYFFYLFLVGAAVAVLISIRYLEIERENHGEFYALLLFAVIGMMCMAAGYDLVLIFIGLELMAISTYILVGFLRSNQRSNEAALKYLLLGAFSSAIFAYGLSLFYGVSGSTNLGDIAHALTLRAVAYPKDPIVILALLTTMTGMLFKIAAAPFHMWAPDVYEGAPTSVTGFMSVSVKAAGWAVMLRMLLFGLYPLRSLYVPLLVFTALLTLTVGNLAAITQTNTKRLLAYSSIAHVGYMMLGLVASDGVANRTGIKGILFYLLVYTFMNLGAFAVLTSLRRRNIIGDTIEDIAGLAQKAPVEAMLMLVFLLSLAGIPPFGRLLRQVLHLPQPDRDRALYAGNRRRALRRGGALLLPEDCQRDVHGQGDQRRAGSVHSGHEPCTGRYRGGHAHHRTFPQHLHPGSELVRLQPWRWRHCTVEVAPHFQRCNLPHCRCIRRPQPRRFTLTPGTGRTIRTRSLVMHSIERINFPSSPICIMLATS